jgi:hypothetical protein
MGVQYRGITLFGILSSQFSQKTISSLRMMLFAFGLLLLSEWFILELLFLSWLSFLSGLLLSLALLVLLLLLLMLTIVSKNTFLFFRKKEFQFYFRKS